MLGFLFGVTPGLQIWQAGDSRRLVADRQPTEIKRVRHKLCTSLVDNYVDNMRQA